jgi:molybdate transport system substrate-binding protein
VCHEPGGGRAAGPVVARRARHTVQIVPRTATLLAMATARWWLVLAAASSLAPAACDARGGSDTLVVSAAADLTAALPALSAAFLAETGTTVTATTGASGSLAQQIMNGAPVDVFASADGSWVDRLEAAGRTVPGTRTTYARGELALVLAPRLRRNRAELADIAAVEFQRIAIANPAFAPYGRAARQALERAGVWDAVQSRIIMGENVRQALAYVTSGNVDAAIVARALVPDATPWFPVPAELHDPLLQEVVVVRATGNEPAARRFVEFLTDGAGRAVLRSYHFALPDRTP